jgi:hypothetical protein
MHSGILPTLQKLRLCNCKLYLSDNGNKDYQESLLLTAGLYLLQFPSKIEMQLNFHCPLNQGTARDTALICNDTQLDCR